VETMHRLRLRLDIDIGAWLAAGKCARLLLSCVPLVAVIMFLCCTHALSSNSTPLQAEASYVTDQGCYWRVSKIVGRYLKSTVRSHIRI